MCLGSFEARQSNTKDSQKQDLLRCKVMFEGQALREVVDYRGAHGVRWVMNGVPLGPSVGMLFDIAPEAWQQYSLTSGHLET